MDTHLGAPEDSNPLLEYSSAVQEADRDVRETAVDLGEGAPIAYSTPLRVSCMKISYLLGNGSFRRRQTERRERRYGRSDDGRGGLVDTVRPHASAPGRMLSCPA